jgi:transposase
MVPLHGYCEVREELNRRIYTMHKHAKWVYGRITKELGVAKSRVQEVVKRGNLRGGHVEDARCSGPAQKVIAFKRRRIQELIDQNLRLSLREITNVTNVGLCSTSIQTIVVESDFRLKVPQKKSFWRLGQKEKHKNFAQRRCRWDSRQWSRVFFFDESTIVYDPFHAGKRCCMRQSEELLEKNLRPSFKSGRTSIGVFACIARGSRSRLWLVRRRAESESITPHDRLGLNASQFAQTLYNSFHSES